MQAVKQHGVSIFLLQMGGTKLIFIELVKNSWFSLVQCFEIIRRKHPRNDKVRKMWGNIIQCFMQKQGIIEFTAELDTLLCF